MATTRGKMMKMVNCYDCKEEIELINTNPYWVSFDEAPEFLCKKCSEGAKVLDNDEEICNLIMKKFIKDHQPERSKREDRESGCSTLNTKET